MVAPFNPGHGGLIRLQCQATHPRRYGWHKLDLMGEGWGWDQLGRRGRSWVRAKVSWERGASSALRGGEKSWKPRVNRDIWLGFLRTAIPWLIFFVTRRQGHQPTLKGWVSGLIQSQEHTYLIMIIKEEQTVTVCSRSWSFQLIQLSSNKPPGGNTVTNLLFPQILPYCEIIIACNILCAVNFPSTKSCLIFKYMYPCVLMHVFSQPYMGTKLLVHFSV